METPADARRKCVACPRRMSKKTEDRHTLCVNCRGFDCDVNTHCEECLEWLEEEVKLYAKYRKSLKSKDSSSKSKTTASPPPADSRPSPQPSPRDDLQSQVDSLNVTVNSLAESLSARLDAFMASFLSQSAQLSSQPRLGPDAGVPQPSVTAGESRRFQALGVPSGTPVVPSSVGHPFGQGSRAPASEQLGFASAPPPLSAPGAAPPPSASQAPPPPPPRYGDPPPQPSTSGWVPPGPPPTRNRRDSHSSSESEASEAESDVSFRDSAASRLADLFTRSVRTLVLYLTPRVSHAAVLSLGSANQSLRPPSSASAPPPLSAPGATPPPSASQAPPPPPPCYGDPPPQPSTSVWVPPGPPPTRNRRDSHSSSESEASEAESDVSFRDSAASCLADLIYEVCPDSCLLSDPARPPRCCFESWFG